MQSFYLFIIQSQHMQSFVFNPHNRHWHHSTSGNEFGRNLWIFQEIPWKLNLLLLQLNLSIVGNFEVSWYKLVFSNIPRQKIHRCEVWGSWSQCQRPASSQPSSWKLVIQKLLNLSSVMYKWLTCLRRSLLELNKIVSFM